MMTLLTPEIKKACAGQGKDDELEPPRSKLHSLGKENASKPLKLMRECWPRPSYNHCNEKDPSKGNIWEGVTTTAHQSFSKYDFIQL